MGRPATLALWSTLLLAPLLVAQRVDERKVAELEQKVAGLEEKLAAEQAGLRATYRTLERDLAAQVREDGGARLAAELARILEPVLTAARTLGEPVSAANRQKVLAHLKKEVAPALGRLELAPLAQVADYLEVRVLEACQESGDVMDALGLPIEDLARLCLRDLLDQQKPFYERWNEMLSTRLQGAATYRKAYAELAQARQDLAVARDPLLRFQINAPPGFARVPAGRYTVRCTEGFVGQGARRKDRVFTLSREVHVGLYEVTNEEYLAWLSSLPEDQQAQHLPRNSAGTPVWPIDEASKRALPTAEMLRHPVVGISLLSALAYAASVGARLPTEEEWCAASGGSESRPFPWGARWEPNRCNDREAGVSGTQVVGAYAEGRGPFGHFDLAGNVAEWTMTYESGKTVDPTEVEDANVAVRGGSYLNAQKDVGTGWVWLRRARFDREPDTGFRLARDPAPAPR